MTPVLYAGPGFSRLTGTRKFGLDEYEVSEHLPGVTLGIGLDIDAPGGRVVVDVSYTTRAGMDTGSPDETMRTVSLTLEYLLAR